MYDYQELDSTWIFRDREKKLSLARAMGFTHITEMYHRVYEEVCSTRYLAEVVGGTPDNARQVLRHMGVPLLSRGGKHRAILTPPLVNALRREWRKTGHRYKYQNEFVRAFREAHHLPVSDRCLENALNGYTWQKEKP